MPVSKENFNVGVLGTGAFTQFSVKAFLEVECVKISGAYDVDKDRMTTFAHTFNCGLFNSPEDVYSDKETDIVYIATPPYLHYEQSKKSLLAGKHVICEKPAALRASEVEELIQIANSNDLLYVVNLMQRYNPLFEKMLQFVKKGVFGNFLHGYFDNYASNETLDPGHWMWDEALSGGIFIEHAVHFFDLFEGWFGPGELISSQKIKTQEAERDYYSEVQATVKYNPGIVNFYHGFTQPSRMDRQEMKFLFELGEVVMYEWVPTQMFIRGLVTNKDLKILKQVFPGAELTIMESYYDNDRHFQSQFKKRTADHMIEMEIGKEAEKLTIYNNLLKDMLSDQISWIRNRAHNRKVTSENAFRSVKIAEMANQMAILL